MFTFTSVNNKATIFGKPIGKELEYTVNFTPIGAMGRFQTEDEELAKKLREHPQFGKKFMEIGATAKEAPPIVDGVRSSATQPELNKPQFDPAKLIEFGRLQVSLLKSDGTYRKDASEENKLKYEALKQELGEIRVTQQDSEKE